MQITDHENHQYGKSAGYAFPVVYNNDKEIWIDFADFAAYLVAAGEFDGYDDSDDAGELWRYEKTGQRGRCFSYTFNEVIKDFMMTGDFDKILAEYIKVQLSSVVDDLRPAA